MPFQFGTNWSRYADATATSSARCSVRSAGGILPRVGLPRHPAVRPQARAAVGAFPFRGHGRGRHADVVVLDTRRQQLDADAGRLRNRRRPILPARLDRRRLQSVVPLPPRAHGHRLLRHHRRSPWPAHRRGTCARNGTCAEARTALQDDDGAADGAGAAAARARRPARASTRVDHQPVKVAAMEGLWNTQARAPAVLFAIPDARNETNHFEIAIPALASLYLKHDIDATVQGLKSVPRRRSAARRLRVLGVPADGRPRTGDARDGGLVGCVALPRGMEHSRAFLAACLRCCPPAFSRCSPAGPSPRSGASRGSSTDCCARATPCRHRSPAATSCCR